MQNVFKARLDTMSSNMEGYEVESSYKFEDKNRHINDPRMCSSVSCLGTQRGIRIYVGFVQVASVHNASFSLSVK